MGRKSVAPRTLISYRTGYTPLPAIRTTCEGHGIRIIHSLVLSRRIPRRCSTLFMWMSAKIIREFLNLVNFTPAASTGPNAQFIGAIKEYIPLFEALIPSLASITESHSIPKDWAPGSNCIAAIHKQIGALNAELLRLRKGAYRHGIVKKKGRADGVGKIALHILERFLDILTLREAQKPGRLRDRSLAKQLDASPNTLKQIRICLKQSSSDQIEAIGAYFVKKLNSGETKSLVSEIVTELFHKWKTEDTDWIEFFLPYRGTSSEIYNQCRKALRESLYIHFEVRQHSTEEVLPRSITAFGPLLTQIGDLLCDDE